MTAKAPPSCPRCGYDQTGAIESWTESCPLQGTCSECGLAFEWVRVLLPEKFAIPWFVEHSRAGWALWRAAWRTWGRVIFPPRFLRAVTMEHEPNHGRVLLWFPLLVIPVLMLAAVVHELFVAFYVIPNLLPPGSSFPGLWYANAALEPFVHFDLDLNAAGAITGWTARFGLWDWLLLVVATSIPWPLILLILPATRARAKVRAISVSRIFVYGLWWLALPALLRLMNGLYLIAATTTGATGSWRFVQALDRWINRLTQNRWMAIAIVAAISVWTAWWWYCAIVLHMRLEQGRRVWAATLSISLLSIVLTAAVALAWGRTLVVTITLSGVAIAAALLLVPLVSGRQLRTAP